MFFQSADATHYTSARSFNNNEKRAQSFSDDQHCSPSKLARVIYSARTMELQLSLDGCAEQIRTHFPHSQEAFFEDVKLAKVYSKTSRTGTGIIRFVDPVLEVVLNGQESLDIQEQSNFIFPPNKTPFVAHFHGGVPSEARAGCWRCYTTPSKSNRIHDYLHRFLNSTAFAKASRETWEKTDFNTACNLMNEVAKAMKCSLKPV